MTDWTALSARASFASHRLIGWIYWDPVAVDGCADLGLDVPGTYYITSRCAPLAPAGHQAVAAAYYSISPMFIEFAMALAEERTSYDAITAVRDRAVLEGLHAYVPEICDGLAALAGPLWDAADALPVSGRVLFAAHRQQPRPDDPLLSAWLAVNCIREWRGDTHFAVLAAEDVSATQAGLLHNAMLNYPPDWIPRSRGSDDAALAEAMADLEARGLADDGRVNAAGLALRDAIEARTDRLAERAWRHLGAALTTTYLDLVEPVGDRLLARIDATAGPEWMPAARVRRHDPSMEGTAPMKVLRTPDERFESLPGFDFAPHYAEVPDGDGGTLRMHYLDEGPADGPVVLLMHGEPSWCYLYRTMIPALAAAGLRCIAPDLVGFGRSDKPTERTDYTYARHVEWVRTLLLDVLDLHDITFFGQDWGGLVGLRVVAENPDRFARVAIGNTGLPTGHEPVSDAFLQWQHFSQTTEDFDIGAIVSMAVVETMPPEVVAAYNAPFPDDTYKAGARVFPTLVPTSPDDPASAANVAAHAVFEAWEKPFLLLFSDSDPITRGADRWFREHVPGAAGQPHTTIEGGGHFLQEDRGPVVAGHLVTFVGS